MRRDVYTPNSKATMAYWYRLQKFVTYVPLGVRFDKGYELPQTCYPRSVYVRVGARLERSHTIPRNV